MTPSSAVGVSGRMLRSGAGGSFKMRAHSAVIVSQSKAGAPVRSSWRIAPIDQMSVRSSTSVEDASCSGDM
jgi:hypothetical protein